MNFMGGDLPSTSLADADVHAEADTSAHKDTDTTSEKPILAHMTKKKPLPPGNVKCLLSQTTNNSWKSGQPQEVNLNGIVYHQVNTASILYNKSSCHTAGKGALVDRGANGGIAGDDVRIIAKNGRSDDIQGIDNHRSIRFSLSQLVV